MLAVIADENILKIKIREKLKDSKSELPNKWFDFLKKFIDEQFETNFEETENGRFLFSLDNFLKTEINLGNEYGFLTLNFKNQTRLEAFLPYSEINQLTKNLNEFNMTETNWSSDMYPCRVYISSNKRKICFYDSVEVSDSCVLFEKRITTFQNIIFSILKLKISTSSK